MSKTAAVTTTAAKRTRLSLPKGRASTKAQAAAVEAVLKPVEPAKPTETIWVSALVNAEGFHRDALQLELAVGLSLFAAKADASKANLVAKKALRDVYAKAGYSCATPLGEDYKTVMRRINVAADLFQFVGGREAINEWITSVRPAQQVATIMEQLKQYNFSGINSVLAYIGKPVSTKRPREGVATGPANPPPQTGMSEADKLVVQAVDQHISARRLAEAQGIPAGRIFEHGHVAVGIPFAATYDEVVALAMDLMTFAKTQMQVTSH